MFNLRFESIKCLKQKDGRSDEPRLQVNGVEVWSKDNVKRGDSYSLSSLPRFGVASSIKIGLIDYDFPDGDDAMGSIKVTKALLEGKSEYLIAFKKGCSYEIKVSVEKQPMDGWFVQFFADGLDGQTAGMKFTGQNGTDAEPIADLGKIRLDNRVEGVRLRIPNSRKLVLYPGRNFSGERVCQEYWVEQDGRRYKAISCSKLGPMEIDGNGDIQSIILPQAYRNIVSSVKLVAR